MATPIFSCGFECGVFGASSTNAAHWAQSGSGATFSTSSPLTGARSLAISSSAVLDYVTTAPASGGAGAFGAGIVVLRFRVNFGSLPAGNIFLGGTISSELYGAYYKGSDGKIYAGENTVGGTPNLGATGVSVTTGTTYYIDVRVNSTANPWLIDVQVNGSVCGQASFAKTASTAVMGIIIGNATNAATWSATYDDVVTSATTGDYPIGDGYVNHFVSIADGTHNVAGANDFERSATGTDITNATTTAYQLVDDVPLKATTAAPADWINLIAPPNATDYVEVVFGPAPGISTPTVAPRAVEVIAGYACSATGVNNIRLALNDNGTTDDVFNGNAALTNTNVKYARKHYAIGPAGAWVIGGGGNGDFTDLRMRCLTSDAAPDPYFTGVMIEAEFAPVNANVTVTPGTASLTASGSAPVLALGVIPSTSTLNTAAFAPTAQLGTAPIPATATLTTSAFAPTVALSNNVTVIPNTATLATSVFVPTAKVNNNIVPSTASLATATFAPAIGSGVVPNTATLTTSTFTPVLDLKIMPATLALATSGFAPTAALSNNIAVIPNTATVTTATFAPVTKVGITVVPSTQTLTTAAFAPTTAVTANQVVVPSTASLSLTGYAPTILGGGSVTVIPSTAALATSGFAPTAFLSDNKFVVPGTATLTLASFAPQVNLAVIPGTNALAATGFAPTINATANQAFIPSTVAVTLNAFAPTILAGNNIVAVPSTVSLTATGFAPIIQTGGNVIVVPDTSALTTTRYAPQLNLAVTPSTSALTTTRFAPQLNLAVTPATRTLSTSSFAPTIVATGHVWVIPSTASVAATRFAPAPKIDRPIIPTTQTLTLSGFAPAAHQDMFVDPQTAALALTGFAPAIGITGQVIEQGNPNHFIASQQLVAFTAPAEPSSWTTDESAAIWTVDDEGSTWH